MTTKEQSMNTDKQLHTRFRRWLRSRKGQPFKAEDFHAACGDFTPEQGWQRAMSGLIASARADGLIRGTAIKRDKYGSYKTCWRAAA